MNCDFVNEYCPLCPYTTLNLTISSDKFSTRRIIFGLFSHAVLFISLILLGKTYPNIQAVKFIAGFGVAFVIYYLYLRFWKQYRQIRSPVECENVELIEVIKFFIPLSRFLKKFIEASSFNSLYK